MDRDEIMRALRAFQSTGLEYVLIGAAAMGFHGWAIAPKQYPRGVFKFRNLEEAQKAREKYR